MSRKWAGVAGLVVAGAAAGTVLWASGLFSSAENCREFTTKGLECAVRADFEAQREVSEAGRFPLGAESCPNNTVSADLGLAKFHDVVTQQSVRVMLDDGGGVAIVRFQTWVPDPLNPRAFDLESRWRWNGDDWRERSCRWTASPFRSTEERERFDIAWPVKDPGGTR